MGSDAGLGGLTPGWKIRPREVPTAWVVRSGYAPRTTLHARPRRRPCITPSCPLEVVNFIQTPGQPMGAHSRDRAAAARRPGFPSNLRSRTDPGFRSTRTDAGRAKGRQCMRHSTIVTLDVLGPRSIRPRAVPRLSNPPDPRHTPPRHPGAEHSGSGIMVLPVAASNAARSNASNATSDKCLAQAQSVYANFADIGIPLAKSPRI